jgi:hypothetical protein
MPNAGDCYPLALVIYKINDTVVTNPNAIQAIGAAQLHTPGWPRDLSQGLDHSVNSLERVTREAGEVFPCRACDCQVMHDKFRYLIV